MNQKYTTLNRIRANSPCREGWEQLLKNLNKTKADDEPLPFLTILESNGLDDAIWCMCTAPEYDKYWRLFAVWCARRVEHLLTDMRGVAAICVAERYAHGMATKEELAAAREFARAAAGWAAGWPAAEAAAEDAAEAAEAAKAAAEAAAEAAEAAEAAAREFAWAAARESARAAQIIKLKEIFS